MSRLAFCEILLEFIHATVESSFSIHVLNYSQLDSDKRRAMFLNRAVHEPFLSSSLINTRKQLNLFMEVMNSYTLVLGEAVFNKVFPIGLRDARHLLVNAVEATDKCIMAQGRMQGLDREWDSLERGLLVLSNVISMPKHR